MISVRFQGKPFNTTVTQVYTLTSNAEEDEVDQSYEDLQDLLVKEETDRTGLHLRPGCEHEATCMVTLPMDSELCAVSIEVAYQWKTRPPDKRASGLVFGLSIA